MDKEYKYMVATRCYTYNHASYIEDTLREFAMQEVDFSMVYCIVDDASTDGEPDVLRRWAEKELAINEDDLAYRKELDYGELVVAPLKVKSNSLFVILLLSHNHKQAGKSKIQYLSEWMDNSKYLALCEGDDYWIDPLKLQKQVDYMETHNNCSLCFTGADVVFDNGFENVDVKEYKSLYDSLEERDYEGPEILKNWILPTASILYKNNITIKNDKRFMFRDIIVGLSAAEEGCVHCIPEKMVVYRRNSNGLSVKHHSLSRRINHYIAIAEVFGDKYKIICERLIKGNIASYLLTGDKNDRKYAVSFLKNKPLYVPSVLFKVAVICINALKKRIFG